jgi:hypothetical protein
MGPSLIHVYTATTIRDDQLRAAATHRRARASAPPERAGGPEAHQRQRTLVRLSLLFARRRGPATQRHSA